MTRPLCNRTPLNVVRHAEERDRSLARRIERMGYDVGRAGGARINPYEFARPWLKQQWLIGYWRGHREEVAGRQKEANEKD